MAASISLLITVAIFLAWMPMLSVAEYPSELYWKQKLGNDTVMPKIIKDAITGSEKSPKNVLKNMINKGFKISEELESSIRKGASILEYFVEYTLTDQQKESILKFNQESNLPYKNALMQLNLTIDPTKYSVYFLENDLKKPGKILRLNFMKVENDAKFIPIQVDEKIPFTSTKLPQILAIFSVRPNTIEAEIMKDTINACEKKALSNEMKFCATTLEGMVDYVDFHLGNRNVRTFEGYVEKNIQNVHKLVNAKKIESNASMVCHKLGYPYAVFYCHNLENTSLYEVSLVDSKGTKMEAVGVCHMDTSSWNPLHVSFLMLKVKPGSPVCHFLDERTIAYVS
nr:responsive to dehydration 22b [Dianthus spiculifolius]